VAASTSGSIINAVIAAGVSSWLKANGFRRRARSFHREHAQFVHTLYFQASRLNEPGAAVFAVNVGIEWPSLYTLWTGAEYSFDAAGCTFLTARIHPENGVGQDFWWPATDPSPAQSSAERIVAVLEAHALPFWERYSDARSALDLLEHFSAFAGIPVWLLRAALLRELGEVDQAMDALQVARRKSPKGFAPDAFEKRLGLYRTSA
jgi:hypothetical protein